MDWKATLEEILAERRQELGEPPSIDDFIALRAGELLDDDRRRLLEHAAVNPEVSSELFDVLRFPEPSGDEDPAADEDGVVERWQALRRRLEAAGDLPARPVPTTPPEGTEPGRRRIAWLPLAAMFLLGIAAALIAGRLREPGDPGTAPEARVNLAIVELLPVDDESSGVRGSPEVVTVAPDAGGLVLALAVPRLAPSPKRGPFRLELTRGDGTSFTVEGLIPGIGGVFLLDLPRGELTAGRHELRLSDGEGRPVARFELEVELRR